MTQETRIKILQIITALLLFISIPVLLFYLGVVVPEYCACEETMYEGQKGINIWGDMVFCDGESQAFAKAFFQFITYILIGFFTILIITNFLLHRLKNNNK